MRFTEFKEYKKGSKGQAKGRDPMPKKSKPSRTGEQPHPLQGKLVGESRLVENARIQHAEDWIFWQGSKGAKRTIEALRSLESKGHSAVSLKWDGSPAVVFGRNEAGDFVFTDKSGFTAKGYDGKAKSAEDLEAMFKNRPGYKKNPKGYGELVSRMKLAFDDFEKAVPKDFRGYFKGDMLYFEKPQKVKDNWAFKPNVVEYAVDVNSELGKKIAKSDSGVVIHRQMDLEGSEQPVKDFDIFQGDKVLVMPPVSVEKPAQVSNEQLNQLEAMVDKNSRAIDEFLNEAELRQKQLTDLPKLLYAYLNSKVDSGLQNLGSDFHKWLETAKVSDRKKAKTFEHIKQHMSAYKAMWDTVAAIIRVKDDVIRQFDQQATIKQSIGGEAGGEGYVLAHPEGDMKLVPREFFTKANRAIAR